VSETVRFREAAIEDLRAMYDYIADAAGHTRAFGFISRVEEHCKGLALLPLRGRASDDLSPGIRILVFERRVTIAYRVDDIGVRIVRIFYAGRDYSEDLFPD